LSSEINIFHIFSLAVSKNTNHSFNYLGLGKNARAMLEQKSVIRAPIICTLFEAYVKKYFV